MEENSNVNVWTIFLFKIFPSSRNVQKKDKVWKNRYFLEKGLFWWFSVGKKSIRWRQTRKNRTEEKEKIEKTRKAENLKECFFLKNKEENQKEIKEFSVFFTRATFEKEIYSNISCHENHKKEMIKAGEKRLAQKEIWTKLDFCKNNFCGQRCFFPKWKNNKVFCTKFKKFRFFTW